WNVAADALLIGCLGDMIPRKGLLHLIGALPLIKQQIPNVCVAAFGREDPEYVAKIQVEIDRHDLHEQVRLVGYRSDIGQVLKACDVFGLATLEDNLPLAILEAMACRLPVVSTHVGGIPECVEDGRTGFLVPAGNQSALAESLLKLLKEPALRSQFGQAGRQKLEAEFSPDTQTRLMEQVFARFARTQNSSQPAASVRPSNEDPTYARAA
ncbi:MAG: glycosyltransferase family 4 protein, partial [Planctomycetales bacterium]|nr:glycosyltransferase family 4 protein [Planctomycetales bacterium]